MRDPRSLFPGAAVHEHVTQTKDPQDASSARVVPGAGGGVRSDLQEAGRDTGSVLQSGFYPDTPRMVYIYT